MNISKFEILLVVIGFLGVGVFLAAFAGGPIYSDELSLMNAGLNNVKDPFHLNRYTHIYLQKPFLELASTPIEGARIYWAFVLTLTGFLAYWCARFLSQENHLLHALTAVILFFSFRFFIDYSGVTIVDFTAMLMVMVYVTVYILAAKNGFTRPWLIALGFIFLMAFKTKETTLVVSVLLLGFGFPDGRKFQIKALGKNLLNFSFGILGGIVFFLVLNALLLHDAFFGFSPASIKAFIVSYANLTRASISPNSPGWYSGVITTIWILPFILYLISGFKQGTAFTHPIRLIWVIPVALVVFLNLMTLWRSYKIDPRFFFPALPVMCILGAQLVPFETPATRKTKIQLWLYILLAILACVGINYAVRPLATYMDLIFEDFLTLIFYPFFISILIISAIFIKKYTYTTILIPLVCVFSMVITPIRTNIKYIAILHQNVDRVQQRFYPFSTFAARLGTGSDQQFYISSSIDEELAMLSSDPNEVNCMYNIYFNRNLRRANFTVSASIDMIAKDLKQGKYDYALLTLQDWQNISAYPTNLSWYELHYDSFKDPGRSLVLLVQK